MSRITRSIVYEDDPQFCTCSPQDQKPEGLEALIGQKLTFTVLEAERVSQAPWSAGAGVEEWEDSATEVDMTPYWKKATLRGGPRHPSMWLLKAVKILYLGVMSLKGGGTMYVVIATLCNEGLSNRWE